MLTKPSFEVRKIENLKDLLQQSSDMFSSKDAFLVKIQDGTYKGISYKRLKEDVEKLGTALLSLGLKDSKVALVGENSYEWCVAYLAVVTGVGIIVPIDKELKKHDIQNILIKSGASALIFSDKLSQVVNDLDDNFNMKYKINMGKKECVDRELSFEELLLKGEELLKKGDSTFSDAEINNEKLSILLFTSGTTEGSKGVMLSHKNICSNIMAICSVIYASSEDLSLSILPLHHTYECTSGFLLMLHVGATISFNEGLKHIAKNMKETKPSILILVPLILESIYKKIWEQASKKLTQKIKLKVAIKVSNLLLKFKIDIRKKLFKPIHEIFGGRVRMIVSGAAAIDPEVSKGLRSMGVAVLQGYGLTECSPVVTLNHEDAYKDASIGLPAPGVDVKILDADDTGVGEIVVKGYNVMLGYYKDQVRTKEVLKNGWFYTGDLGYIDKEGYVYITGRKKNVIVTKNGKNIFPEELEMYLNKSDFIKESLVIGEYEKEMGETEVVALIVPDYDMLNSRFPAQNITEEFINTLINAKVREINRSVPLYKRIKRFRIHGEEFEKTTTKKIKRYVV